MEDQDKLRQMRSQDVLKQPNTSSFQDGMDQCQKPTDEAVQDAIDKLTYARDQDRVFDDGTFVEALDTALACMRQMRSDPCEWCDKDGPETWNYTRSGKYIPEYQTPRNYCRACGRPLKGGE